MSTSVRYFVVILILAKVIILSFLFLCLYCVTLYISTCCIDSQKDVVSVTLAVISVLLGFGPHSGMLECSFVAFLTTCKKYAK